MPRSSLLCGKVQSALKRLIPGGTLLLSGCSGGQHREPLDKVVPPPTLTRTATVQRPTGPGLPRTKKAKPDARDFKARVLEKR
jgi:hypothetical protein